MSTLHATPSPLSPAPLSVRWTIFERVSSSSASPSRSRSPAGVERSEQVQLGPPADLSGHVLCERYELTRRLGYGGMGEVYEARFLASGQRVAVKLLFARFAERSDMLTRFRHELQVLETSEHPGIVRVRDFDTTVEGRPFLVMELIEGRNLRSLLREEGRRPIVEVIEIGMQLCEALDLLHGRGVIHRDLTPRNVLVDEHAATLRVKLIDFGISKLTSLFYVEERAYMTPPEQRLRTRAGVLLGTPGYTAPEAADSPPSPRQDVFSLGVLLFELATGRRPPAVWLSSIPDDVDHEALGLDRHSWRTLLKAIEPTPDVRYQTAREMSEALEDLRLIVGDGDEVPAGGETAGSQPRGAAPSEPSQEEARDVGAVTLTNEPTQRRQGRGLWLAVLILGLYAAVDLALHVRAYLADPPSSSELGAEISKSPTEAEEARSSADEQRGRGSAQGAGPHRGADGTSELRRPSEHGDADPHVGIEVARETSEHVGASDSRLEERSAPAAPAPMPRRATPRQPPSMRQALRRAEGELRACSRLADGLLLVEFATDGSAHFAAVTPVAETDAALLECVRRATADIRFTPTRRPNFIEEYRP